MRKRSRLSVLLVLLLTTLLLLQPLSAGAADCSKEKAAVDELAKNIARLTDDLNKQRAELAAAEKDLQTDLQNIDTVQQELQGEAARVEQELADKGLSDAAKALAVQVAIGIAIAAAGPEAWGLLGHTATAILELADQAHTAHEIYKLLREGGESASAVDDLTGGFWSLADARAYANANNLPEMNKMLDQLMSLADLLKKFDQDWSRIKNAANAIAGDQALLDKFAKQLKDALAAYWACLDQPGPTPSACEGQSTNPNGAGVCR